MGENIKLFTWRVPRALWTAGPLLGLVFFLRAESVESQWRELSPAWALISWLFCAALLLPFFLALRSDAKPRQGSPWVPAALTGLLLLAPWVHPWTIGLVWASAPGERMPALEAAWLLVLGLGLVGLLSRSSASARAWSLPAAAFLAQQTWASLVHYWDRSRSDMLWFLRWGGEEILSGRNPYVEHVGPWPYGYYPGLILAHLPTAWLDLDPRVWPILSGVLALGILGLLSDQPSLPALCGAAGLFLGNMTFNSDDLYVCPEWLLAGLVLLALKKGSGLGLALALAWALAAREWFWILFPFLFEAAWRRLGPGQAKKAAGFAIGGAAALILPFFGLHPGRILATTFHRVDCYQGMGQAGDGRLSHFGLTWPLVQAGLAWWVLPLAGFAFLGVWLVFRRGMRDLPACVAWGALALALFQVLNPASRSYQFFLPAYLVLASLQLRAGESRRGVPEVGGRQTKGKGRRSSPRIFRKA